MANNDQSTPIFGIIEHAIFPELGIDDVPVKIDTGAYSGALHCASIEVARNAAGQKVLRFTPIHDQAKTVELTRFLRAQVRSSNGHLSDRYLIDTPVLIQGRQYTIRIGLSDRSTMKTDVLIGRRFLRQNGILVDVRINQDEDDDGGKKI